MGQRSDAGARGPARERILDAAAHCFAAEGINAVGVDRIIRESDAAKATLYKHFAGKDDLIAAYLAEASAAWWDRVGARLTPLVSPDARILALFDDLAERVAAPDYRGCPFINAAAELPDPEHPARRIIDQHRGWVAGLLVGLAEEGGHPAAGALASQVGVLHDGAMVAAGIDRAGAVRLVDDARAAAARLIAG